MISGDHLDYRMQLFEDSARRTVLEIQQAVDRDENDCATKERNTGSPLPEAVIKTLRNGRKLRPAELLYGVPRKEELERQYKALSPQDSRNYDEIFNRSQRFLRDEFKGNYEQALLVGEEIKTLAESRILRRHILAKLPEIANKQAQLQRAKM